MVQNLKVDVIYHRSPSDFEMEFNLCGCCRMRLLSDKTDDKKGFVKALARDVARSRVIIACGSLFGDDGIINIVAKVIGGSLCVCDNKTYGINGEEKIHIIKGSTPLVTSNGYFGGCIIESGPQTIILLTENKTFRKSIMQNLIHPYIEDISYIPTTNSPISAPVQAEVEVPVINDEGYLTQPDDYYDEEEIFETPEASMLAQQDEHNIDFVMDGEEDAAEEPEALETFSESAYDNLYTEIETPDEIQSRYENPYTPSENDDMFISEREEDEVEKKQKKVSNIRAINITIVIFISLLLLAVLALVYLMVLRPISMGVNAGDYIKEIFGLASGNTLV